MDQNDDRISEQEEVRLAFLQAELAVGLNQFERGEGAPFTHERYELIMQRAIEDWKSGKPIKDAIESENNWRYPKMDSDQTIG